MNPNGNKVVVSRRIAATREELFDAWLDPEGMREWLLPGDAVSAGVQMDPRVGGALRIIIRNPTQEFEHLGEFRVVDRPSKLVFTWHGANSAGRTTLVTVEFLKVSDTETELVLTHEDLQDEEIRRRYESGWGKISERLENFVQRR